MLWYGVQSVTPSFPKRGLFDPSQTPSDPETESSFLLGEVTQCNEAGRGSQESPNGPPHAQASARRTQLLWLWQGRGSNESSPDLIAFRFVVEPFVSLYPTYSECTGVLSHEGVCHTSVECLFLHSLSSLSLQSWPSLLFYWGLTRSG